jgi:hypothetical protein
LPAAEADALMGSVPVVRLDLTRADVRELANLLNKTADPAAEGPSGPIGLWIGAGEAAARVGVEPSTIRGWVARRGPKAHPFPEPGVTYKGRNLWQKAVIETWAREQLRLEEQHRSRPDRNRPDRRR